MVKAKKGAVIGRLQSTARLSRTSLAARLVTHDLYAGQDQIMLALSGRDGQTPGALAAQVGVRPPTITKTINRLAAQGYLEKRPSSDDARRTLVFLSEAGHEAIRAIEKSLRKTEKQALKGLDKKDQKQLSKLLQRVEANFAEIDPEMAGEPAKE